MTFPTRKAAKDWVRDEIKNHYDLEGVITEPLHVAVLHDLLDRDDDTAGKTGVGIKEFFIRRTALGGGHIQYVRRGARGIWVRRIDGSEDDWSYTSAIDQEGLQSDVRDALRAVINEDRLSFREQAFAHGPVQCARTGVMIDSYHDAEVRYANPSGATWPRGLQQPKGAGTRSLRAPERARRKSLETSPIQPNCRRGRTTGTSMTARSS